MYFVATVQCEPACPRDPKSLMSGTGTVVTFGAGRGRSESLRLTKRENMCADRAQTLDPCRVDTPYRRRWKLGPKAAVLTRAQATYRSRFRGAYAPHRSGAMPPCRPSTAKSSASRTDPHDAPDPPTVRGLERAELRVLPVSPTPPMAAGQSEPQDLGHAWRLVSRGVERLRTMQLHMAALPETCPNIALSGRFTC